MWVTAVSQRLEDRFQLEVSSNITPFQRKKIYKIYLSVRQELLHGRPIHTRKASASGGDMVLTPSNQREGFNNRQTATSITGAPDPNHISRGALLPPCAWLGCCCCCCCCCGSSSCASASPWRLRVISWTARLRLRLRLCCTATTMSRS
ncbi:unnamed protein product [Ectocarpus sp. 13 AM-2016]